MRTLTTPIVGAHFRPPAKQLLEVLPIGTPMLLRAEPDNPYDENAIQVLVSLSKTYPISQWAVLAAALEGTGYTPQDLIDREANEGPLHIGYIPRTGAKTAQGGPGNIEVAQFLTEFPYEASFGFAAEGYPTVKLTVAEPA